MSTEGKILPRKRLIVCCDGTWQTGDKTYGTSPSNIVKLSRMIGRQSVPEGIPQVVYYQSGVGTGDFVSGIFQGSFGWGLADNVASAYHYLSANFEQGNGKGSPDEEDSNHKTYSNDEIFLFGFSRGAYTARALGGLITEMGLLKPKYLNDFPRAYEIYKKLGKMAAPKDPSESPISSPISRYVSELTTDEREFWNHLACDKEDGKTFRHVKIKAIGVWDTVGALGIPDSPLTTIFPQVNGRYQFHNTSLNGDIENAFQALALDERRGAFPPTLWYLPNEHSKDEFSTDGSSKNSPCTNLKQCWFPGFHESIGGGGVGIQYWFQHWFPKLSTIFMPDTSEMHEVTLAWMCDQVDGLLSFDEATVEYILLRHGKNRHNWASCKEFDMMHILFFFRLILFGGSRTRKPGRYYRSDVQTNESIHPSQGKAKWVRKEVQPVLLKASQDRVELPEWIIRQSSEKINFEAKILPSDLEEEPPSGTPGDNPENQQYWTRTIWPLPNPVIRRNINMRPYWNDLEGM
ncbi:Cysteine synthase a [Lasiodiplodia theobromae]|uniref:Cysteine synthase a n=1 Tax=Lasiodiplodia theobromae TaxID=45133 RepID=UPI0015C3430B|nr:Cysteine synthase a [Lasiodiplodia theobromae]KAF4539197.1 Cysteine synthase a [Lasiodiplodia theobromae]